MFEIGSILDNKYQIQAHLGTGGMGEVYRVLDLEQSQECALKILNEMMDAQAVRRFHREFQVLSRFQHPRLVRTYTWGFAEERPYFTMEYLPGKTLEKIIADQALLGQFRASHFFDLMQQIVEGLAYIHAQGMVHRDLKPSNIIVLETEEGIETTILDLGLAKFRHLHSVSITQTGAAIGTVEYMSPEQGKGLWVDHRSDLYSLGVVLYEMLTGVPPFSGQNPVSVILKHIRESPPPMAEARVEVPAQTQQIVLKLLAKEPVDRFQSGEEVLRALPSEFVPPDDEQHDVPMKVVRPQFVGRESELKTLRAMLKDVQIGEQRVVLISGEAGVGKSRLVEELLGDARVYDFLSLKSAGREEGGQIYGALNDAFRQVKTTDLVGRVPDSLETDKFSVMERWLQLLKTLRAKKPILLCLEDIQWLDELTLEFLQYVLRDPEPCPFLLCLTCRWSNLEPLAEEIENFIHSNEFAGVTHIKLKNLSQEASGYLAASMFGERSIPSDALQTLFRETGGQPLFVVEAVRALVNADVVRQNVSGGWQWGEFPETLLSDDISEVLYRRITTLTDVQRRVLEYACVFPSDFSFELLAAVWRGDELELLDVLDDLIAEGLLDACGEAEDRYQFSQDLCRRAIYDRMQNVRQRLLHREIGSALEKMDGVEELTEELADHFAAAEEHNKALKYMRLSGKKALEKHAYGQALRRFEAVWGWASRWDGVFELQADAIGFLCDYADVLRNCGKHNRALEFLEEAKALLPDDRKDLKARILWNEGGIHSLDRRGEIAEECMLEALRLYRELDDLDGEIQTLSSLAYLCDVSGRNEEAIAYMRREIEKRHTLKDPQNGIFIQGREGQAALVEFRFETAKEHLKAAVKTSQKLGFEYHRIGVLNSFQRIYFYLGDFNLVEAVCNEVISQWQKRGVVYWEAMNLLWLGELALERGAFAEALEYAEISSERFLQTPRRDYVYRAYAIAATATARMGDTEVALEWAERASEGTQQTSGMFTGILPLVYCGIGTAFAQAERIAEAEEAFEQAIECRRESKGDHWARALLMAGEFYLQLGDVPRAKAHLEEAKQAFEEMEMSYFLEKTQVVLNQLSESSHDKDAVLSSEISVDTLSVDRLRLLYDVSRELTTERDVKVLLDRTLGNLLAVYPAERVLVAIKNDTPKGFVVDAVRHHNLEVDDAEALSRGIIRRVIETNEPVLSIDAQTDDRLNRYQSVIDYNIRSVLCVPVFHFNEGVMGALYVDHRGISNAFSEVDQTFLQAFANLVGVALVNARMYEQSEEKARYFQQEVERRYQLGDMVGQSDAMQRIYQLIETAAKSDIPVLVQGETGTGKELAARAIHYNSTRKDQRFLSQNCAALSPELLQSELFGHKKGAFTGAAGDHKGIFEAADGGTVLLDEIADAPPQLQRSLLRVLQEGEIRRVGETVDRTVDVRIIAATNRDLKKEVEKGSFREDLYYRLQGVQIDMPPLREHIEDVPLLAEHLLIRSKKEANKSIGGLTVGAIRTLTNHDWPGNVRELENKIQLAVALADEEGDITPDLFLEAVEQEFQGYLQDRMQEYEKRVIRNTLEKYEGNITHAARELGVTRVGLYKKIDRLGLREM